MSCGVSRQQSGGGAGITFGFTQDSIAGNEHLLGPQASYAPYQVSTHCASQNGGAKRRTRRRRRHRKQRGGTHYTWDFSAPRVGGLPELLPYSPEQCGGSNSSRKQRKRKNKKRTQRKSRK